jgi:hypothetical protein
VHIQFGGFGVLIKFRFQYLHLSRGTDFNLVGLGIPLRCIAKPSYARHCTNPNVAGNAPGQTEFQSKKGQKRGFFLKIWTQTDVKKT